MNGFLARAGHGSQRCSGETNGPLRSQNSVASKVACGPPPPLMISRRQLQKDTDRNNDLLGLACLTIVLAKSSGKLEASKSFLVLRLVLKFY